MPIEPLFNVEEVPLDRVMYDRAAIERYNPHRGEIAQLDAVLWHDDTCDHAVALREVRDDEFWVAGHIPGNPLLPGVLMVETGAQLASFMYYRRSGLGWFAGFTRIDETTFRGHVKPGDRLLVAAKCLSYSPKRFISLVQGLVEGTPVFQSKITGMVFPKLGEVREPSAGTDPPA